MRRKRFRIRRSSVLWGERFPWKVRDEVRPWWVGQFTTHAGAIGHVSAVIEAEYREACS